jgi:sugar O-acyltransferase (sialic acid O-acetyltransferase NeuD family)
MSTTPPVVIIGSGGHAVSVSETVSAMGLTISYYVSEGRSGGSLLGRPVREVLETPHVRDGGLVVLAIGDNASRARVWKRLAETVPHEQMPAIIHPSAVIAASAEIASGSVILQGAIIGAGSQVTTGCLVNSRASLDHESTLGTFSSLAPGAITGGRVTIGDRVAICIAACVRQGVSIGHDTVVGASSYVNRDLPSGVVAYGVPARIIRSRKQDDPYLQ